MKKDTVSRDLVETMLNKLGGCGASEEWAKGWDAAIDTAIGELKSLPSTIKPKRKNFHGLKNVRPARICEECQYFEGGIGEEEETYCALNISDDDPLLVENKNGDPGCLYSDRQLSIREEYYDTFYERNSTHDERCGDNEWFLPEEDYEE